MDFPFVDLHTHQPKTLALSVVNLPKDGTFPAEEPVDGFAKHYYCYGIHPYWVEESEAGMKLLEELLEANRIVAVGETGIDKTRPRMEQQLEAFERQIVLSETYRKPMILHNVRGTAEILRLHKKHQPRQTWVIHGFNGSEEEAKQLIDRGIHLSVGHGIRYENRKIVKAIPSLPLDYLHFETDDSPIHVREVDEIAAELLHLPLEVLKEKIFVNFARLIL